MPIRKGTRRGLMNHRRPSEAEGDVSGAKHHGRIKARAPYEDEPMSKRNGNLPSLEEARTLTPPVDPAEALRKDLRMAFLADFGAQDMAKLAGKLKEMALGGDLKAMQLITTLLVAPPPATRVTQIVQVNQQPGPQRRKDVETIAADGKLASRDEVPATIREDCADLIRLEGPLTSTVLGDRCGTSAHVVEVMMTEDEWFEQDETHRWHLTGAAFAVLNAERD